MHESSLRARNSLRDSRRLPDTLAFPHPYLAGADIHAYIDRHCLADPCHADHARAGGDLHAQHIAYPNRNANTNRNAHPAKSNADTYGDSNLHVYAHRDAHDHIQRADYGNVDLNTFRHRDAVKCFT